MDFTAPAAPRPRLRRLPAVTISTTREDFAVMVTADRMIAWDARQSPAIRESARARSFRIDEACDEAGFNSVITAADAAAIAAMDAAGIPMVTFIGA